MRLALTRLDLSIRRRSFLAYLVGTALYVIVIVALYPEFKDTTSLNDLTKNGSKISALFGITGSLTSPGGWLNANIFANFLPLIMLLMTIGYGAAAIAGQDEVGTLCMLTTLPISRRSLVLQKSLVIFVQSLALAVALCALVLVGRSFQLSVSIRHVVESSVAMFLLGYDFGVIALCVGAKTGRRGATLGICTAVAAASYLVSSLAPVIGWLQHVKYASLFYWSVGTSQIESGVSALDALVLCGVGVAATYAAIACYQRLDVQ